MMQNMFLQNNPQKSKVLLNHYLDFYICYSFLLFVVED